MLLYQIAFSLLFEKRNRIALQWLDKYGSAQEAWHHLTEKGMGEALQRAERELAPICSTKTVRTTVAVSAT